MAWYFKFDGNTKEFIPGAVNADEQPDNSTTVDPAGVQFPVFDSSTNTWKSNQSKIDELNKQQAEQQSAPDPYQQQLSTMANQFLKQNIALTKRVAELESKGDQ